MIAKARWIILIVLTALLGFGAFLRFENLDKQSYWMDEGYTVNAVISGMENGTKGGAAILNSGDTYFCPVYCHPTSVIVSLLGNRPLAYRFLSAVGGTAFILVAYWITKRFFQDTTAALLAAGFTAFSYWQIAWSRQARWYTLLEVFFWLAILAFHAFLKSDTKRKRIASLTLTIIATILAIATQGIAYLLPVFFLIWYLVERRPPLKRVLAGVGATVLFLLIAEFALHLVFLQRVFEQLTLTGNITYYLSFYGRTYWPLLLICAFGLWQSSPAKRKLFAMLLLPFFLYLVIISTFTEIIHYRYLFHATPAFLIIAAVSLVDTFDKLSKRTTRIIFLIATCALFFLTGQGIIFPKDFYSLEADDPTTLKRTYYAYTPQPNFTGAYKFIEERLKASDIVISVQPQFSNIFLRQPGYWLAYDYLGRDRLDPMAGRSHERYVNAAIIQSKEALASIMDGKHGYLVLDAMALDGRISTETLSYIQSHSIVAFYEQRHSYSQIWVYQF